jgi:quinol monooxygenase YgiN
MNDSGPGLVVLYRWRLHPGSEASFTDAWSRITESLRRQAGSQGSRLHRGNDGLWYGYAQWPDDTARQRAFAQPLDPEASAQMRAAVAESLPEVLLVPVADFLVLPRTTGA